MIIRVTNVLQWGNKRIPPAVAEASFVALIPPAAHLNFKLNGMFDNCSKMCSKFAFSLLARFEIMMV